jgi:acyl-CoA synthetase (NDP forming)
MVETALAGGSSGPIYLVNPKYQEIEKTQCYPCVSSLREAPDLVVAGVGGQQVEAVLDEALARFSVPCGTLAAGDAARWMSTR